MKSNLASSFLILSILMLILVQNISSISTVNREKSTAGEILYDYYPGYDSYGGDLRQVTGKVVSELKALCDQDSACLGFHSEGYLKSTIKPVSQFIKLSTDAQGIYLKHVPPAASYYFVPSTIISGGSMSCQPQTISLNDRVARAKPLCDSDPACLAYDTSGCLKNNISGSRFGSQSIGVGTYIKQSSPSSSTNNYSFYQGRDSYGGDLIYYLGKTVDQLRQLCDSNSNCVGFNTAGYLKRALQPVINWISFEASNRSSGFYMKGKPTIQLLEKNHSLRGQKTLKA